MTFVNKEHVKITSVLGKDNWVGKLVLQYYDGDSSPKERIIPFYEDVVIGESQSSRLASYDPIGRAGAAYSYLGANSRSFKLNFNITLPHLYHVYEKENNSTRGYSRAQRKAMMLLAPGLSEFIAQGVAQRESIVTTQDRASGGVAIAFDEKYEDILDDIDKKLYNFNKISSPLYQISSEGSKQRRNIINRIGSMVASIRSSVVNSAQNTMHGIPIVRLFYGILYDNVPCVCKSYNINFDPMHGFDTKTLLPRVLTINMNLEETRTFPGASEREIDGIKGWEVILPSEHEFDGTTMDPRGSF